MAESCPTTRELEAFAVGDIAADRLETIAKHLDGCPDCEASLAAFDDRADGLLSDLKDAAGNRDGWASSPDLDPGSAYARQVGEGPVRLGRFELRDIVGNKTTTGRNRDAWALVCRACYFD